MAANHPHPRLGCGNRGHLEKEQCIARCPCGLRRFWLTISVDQLRFEICFAGSKWPLCFALRRTPSFTSYSAAELSSSGLDNLFHYCSAPGGSSHVTSCFAPLRHFWSRHLAGCFVVCAFGSSVIIFGNRVGQSHDQHFVVPSHGWSFNCKRRLRAAN